MVFGRSGEKGAPLFVFELQRAEEYGVGIPYQITFIGTASRGKTPFEKLLKIPAGPGGEKGQGVFPQFGDCHSRNDLVLIQKNQIAAASVTEFFKIRPVRDHMRPCARQMLQKALVSQTVDRKIPG